MLNCFSCVCFLQQTSTFLFPLKLIVPHLIHDFEINQVTVILYWIANCPISYSYLSFHIPTTRAYAYMHCCLLSGRSQQLPVPILHQIEHDDFVNFGNFISAQPLRHSTRVQAMNFLMWKNKEFATGRRTA